MKKYIVLEGIHGSGKSTVGKALAKELQSRGTNALYYHFPDEGDALGQVIRQVVATKELVHHWEITGALYAAFANRFHLLTEGNDTVYILDRHSVTTGLIFQEKIPQAVRNSLYSISINALKEHGIAFYLSVDIKTAKERQQARNNTLRNASGVWKDKGNDQFVEQKFYDLAKKYDEYLLPAVNAMGIPMYKVSNNAALDQCVAHIIDLLSLHE